MRQEKGEVELWGGWLFVVVLITCVLIMTGIIYKTAFGQTGTEQGFLHSGELRPRCVPEFCAGHPEGHNDITGTLRVTIPRETECLAQMEAAMRAMEDWIFPVERTLIVAPNGDWVWEFPDQPAVGIPKSEVHLLVKAREQWATVKRECWRQ